MFAHTLSYTHKHLIRIILVADEVCCPLRMDVEEEGKKGRRNKRDGEILVLKRIWRIRENCSEIQIEGIKFLLS